MNTAHYRIMQFRDTMTSVFTHPNEHVRPRTWKADDNLETNRDLRLFWKVFRHNSLGCHSSVTPGLVAEWLFLNAFRIVTPVIELTAGPRVTRSRVEWGFQYPIHSRRILSFFPAKLWLFVHRACATAINNQAHCIEFSILVWAVENNSRNVQATVIEF